MEGGLRCVVFSRDRAMQLDAFLRSVEYRVPHLFDNIIVLYRCTGDEYAMAYERLRPAWSHVLWVQESSFKTNLLDAIGQEDWLVFHTDDDLYFSGVDHFRLHDDEACFTLRLGLNTTYCYPLNIVEELRGAIVAGGRVAWCWRDQGPGAYSYPLALNGHVFRQEEARKWLARAEYATPNELESTLQHFLPEIRPRMASFLESKVVNIPANIVNETFQNRQGGLHDVAELNDRFLADDRIDVAAMTFSDIDACHIEIPYIFTHD